MSQENVEAVHAWVAAINRRDLAALLELADPALEFRSYLAALSGSDGAYRGHDGLERYLRDLSDAWESFQVEQDECRDLGDVVLMEGRLRAKGRSSGLKIEERLTFLHTFRDGTGPGRYIRHQYFATLGEALEAVGLSE